MDRDTGQLGAPDHSPARARKPLPQWGGDRACIRALNVTVHSMRALNEGCEGERIVLATQPWTAHLQQVMATHGWSLTPTKVSLATINRPAFIATTLFAAGTNGGSTTTNEPPMALL